MSNDKLISLVRKLSAITKDNGSNENEVLIAAQKIEQLKNEYNIDLKELEVNEYEAIEENITLNYIRVPQYLQSLMSYLADNFNCQVIRDFPKDKKTTFILIGLPHDVIICNHFYKYLSRVLISESKGRKNKNSFCIGMIHSIMEKLNPNKDDHISEEHNTLVVNKNAAINRYIEDKIGKLKIAKGGNMSLNNDAYNAGKDKGKNVSLSQPIKGNGQLQIDL